MDKHPDLMEMRARYEEASETPQAQTLEGLTMLAGLYTAISPWVIQFSGTAFDLTMSNLITGTALVVLAIGFASAYSRTHTVAWVVPMIGAWTVIAPFVIMGAGVSTGMVLSNVITGGVTILLGIGVGSLIFLRRKS